MTAFYRAFAIAMLFHSAAVAAEHDWPAAPPAPQAPPSRTALPRLSLALTNESGLAVAPFVTSAFPEVSGFVTVTTPAVAVRVTSLGWLRARIPIAYARLDFPARAQVGESAIGNLELAFEGTLELGTSTRLGLLGAFQAPTAGDGPDASLLANRVLALASAIDANRSSSLFTPGAMGLRAGVSVEHFRFPLQFRASLDVPLALRLSRANLPEGTETHAVGLAPTLDLKAAWWVNAWFGVALGVALVADVVRAQEPARASDRKQRLQPVLEPSLHFRLGRHVKLALDASVPVGGALGGNAWSVGPSVRVDF